MIAPLIGGELCNSQIVLWFIDRLSFSTLEYSGGMPGRNVVYMQKPPWSNDLPAQAYEARNWWNFIIVKNIKAEHNRVYGTHPTTK